MAPFNGAEAVHVKCHSVDEALVDRARGLQVLEMDREPTRARDHCVYTLSGAAASSRNGHVRPE